MRSLRRRRRRARMRSSSARGKPAVADDVRHEDRRKFACFAHRAAPMDGRLAQNLTDLSWATPGGRKGQHDQIVDLETMASGTTDVCFLALPIHSQGGLRRGAMGRLRPFAKPPASARFLRRGDVSSRREADTPNCGMASISLGSCSPASALALWLQDPGRTTTSARSPPAPSASRRQRRRRRSRGRRPARSGRCSTRT